MTFNPHHDARHKIASVAILPEVRDNGSGLLSGVPSIETVVCN